MASWDKGPHDPETGMAVIVSALLLIVAVVVALVMACSAQGATWREDFDGRTLSPAFMARSGCPAGPSAEDWLCYSPANAWQRHGQLHLRQTTGTQGRPYDGAEVSTMDVSRGWPSRQVQVAWSPPLTVRARVKWNPADGFWQAFVAIGTDRVRPTELDIAEESGTREFFDFCALHQTLPDGTRQHLHFGVSTPFNITSDWHTYWLRYPGDGTVTFGVDRLTCGTSDVVNVGPIGLDFAAKSAPPRFGWVAAGGPVLEPSVQYRVDWVKVTQP